MRVIAGSARRTSLAVLPGSSTRPFLEQARGAVFNVLMARVPGARVLDLYAGSGALGLEALSRGATHAVFVEADRAVVKVLRENIERCHLTSQSEVRQQSVESALRALSGSFDLIFLDPPFPDSATWHSTDVAHDIIADSERLLAPQGRLLFRCEIPAEPPPNWHGMAPLRDRNYGRSRVCLYGRDEEYYTASD